MAEVKLTKPTTIPVSYVDDVVLTTAKLTPPSITFIDPITQVTAQPAAILVSYTNGEEVTFEARTTRNVNQTVNLEGVTQRGIVVDGPFRVTLNGATVRDVLNSVELDSTLYREIISYNVRLEYGTRRVVTYDIPLEGNMVRKTQIELKLSSKAERNIIINGELIPPEVPHKEYGSFVAKEKLFRVQHDVLDENVSDNPYFAKDIANLNNSVLLTHNQTVIKAINEIFVNQRDLFFNTVNAVKKFNEMIGDIVVDRTLNRRYQELGATCIIDALLVLSGNISKLSEFIGYAESNETDTDIITIVDSIKALDDKIKAITVEWEDIKESDIEWIFKATQTLPELEDRVYHLMNEMTDRIQLFESRVDEKFRALTNYTNNTLTENYNGLLEKINDLNFRVEILENAKRLLSSKIDLLAEQVLLEFRRYTDITEEDIRAIFAMLENITPTDDPESLSSTAYRRLVEYIDENIANVNGTISGLDNRVTELEAKFGTTFTSDNLTTEDEIRNLFGDNIVIGGDETSTNIEDLLATEADVQNVFFNSNGASTEELLNMVASNATVQDTFAVESPNHGNSMQSLMTDIAIAAQNNAINEEENNNEEDN